MEELKQAMKELEVATRRYNKFQKESSEKLDTLEAVREAARAKVLAAATSVGVVGEVAVDSESA